MMADQTKGKDTLMRLLLTAPIASSHATTQGIYGRIMSGHVLSSANENEEIIDSMRLTKYLRHIASHSKEDSHIVLIDHGYSRPWNWRCENNFVKPTRYLFFTDDIGSCAKQALSKTVIPRVNRDGDEEVDVVGELEEEIPCSLSRVRPLMEECENHVNMCRPREEEKEDWEESISKVAWTKVQTDLFEKVMKLLHHDRLTRLVKSGSWNEPIWRRLVVDKSARRFRVALSDVGWDMRLAQWLHITLMDNLNNIFLAIYLDILQKLRSKIPNLVDRMINVSTHVGKTSLGNADNLCNLLKRPWDPVKSYVSQPKPKKLPSNPILMVIPASPRGLNMQSARTQFWLSYFSALGQVITVSLHSGRETTKLLMTNVLDQMVAATRAKITEVRSNYPTKPIILIGWNSGASLACQVAMMEQVVGVVCLGFPMLTVDGKRGEPNDILLDLRSPTMFIIGEMSSTVNQEDIEDMRERMRVETNLVMIASADDKLRMSWSKKMLEGATQSMVDRVILDEISDFLARILLQPFPAPLRPAQVYTSSTPPQSTGDSTRTVTSIKSERKPVKAVTTTVSSSSAGLTGKDSEPSQKRSYLDSPVSGTAIAASTSSTKTTLTTLSPLVSATSSSPGLRKKRGPPLQKMSVSPNTSTATTSEGNRSGTILGSRSLTTQSGSDMSASGITLNIGSLASLAPVGPIRLGPTTSKPTVQSDGSEGASRGRANSLKGRASVLGLDSPTSTVQGTNLSPRRKLPVGRPRSGTTGTMTSLSSLLQSSSGIKNVSSSSSTILLGTSESHIKVVSSSGSSQSSASVTTPARLLSTSGRIIDLSKLTILSSGLNEEDKTVLGTTSSGNVVMLSDGSKGGTSLVPLSGISNTVAIVPLTGERHVVGRRSVAVVPKISTVGHESNVRGKTTVPRLTTYTVASTNMQKQKQESKQNIITVSGSETLTPDKILDLPIIIADDDDDMIEEASSTETSRTPIVVPITSSADTEDDTSAFVTSCDTISFPLDDENEDTSTYIKTGSSAASGQNIVVIKASAPKEQSQIGRVSIFDKGPRIIQGLNKVVSSGMSRSANTSSGNIKGTKIYFDRTSTPIKIREVNASDSDEPKIKRNRVEIKTVETKKGSVTGKPSAQ